MLKQLWVIHGIQWILLESLDQKCKALIKESGRERERERGEVEGRVGRRDANGETSSTSALRRVGLERVLHRPISPTGCLRRS